jgi:N-acetylneuraminate synthase
VIPFIEINGRRISPAEPVFIVAEISANHGQKFEQSVQLIKAAKEAGADAVKFQTYTPDTITIKDKGTDFLISGGTLWDGRTLYDLYSDAYMPWEWQPELKKAVEEMGLIFFSTAFDSTAVDFLEEIGVPVHKVASPEIVDIPLIENMARTGKPLIISTGMATLGEIEEAVHAARSAGACQIALLKCTSAYPAPPEEMNLRTIPHLSETFNLPAGLSDHTQGINVPVAAVALGACIIEKHFTLSRTVPGPDSAFSLEPHEFKAMVDAVRITEKALGKIHYGLCELESKSKIFRRSLYVVKDIHAGEVFTETNIRSLRPALGLHPRHWKDVIGRRAASDIPAGTPLHWSLVC